MSVYGISNQLYRKDWTNDIKTNFFSAASSDCKSFSILTIYYQKFGKAENSKYKIVRTEVTQHDIPTPDETVATLIIDWVELKVATHIYKPPLPNLNLYLPDVTSVSPEHPLPLRPGHQILLSANPHNAHINYHQLSTVLEEIIAFFSAQLFRLLE